MNTQDAHPLSEPEKRNTVLDKIREKHWKDGKDTIEPWCHWDDAAWPCHVAVVFDELDEVTERLHQAERERDEARAAHESTKTHAAMDARAVTSLIAESVQRSTQLQAATQRASDLERRLDARGRVSVAAQAVIDDVPLMQQVGMRSSILTLINMLAALDALPTTTTTELCYACKHPKHNDIPVHRGGAYCEVEGCRVCVPD